MSNIRKRFRVQWNDGDPVELRSNAWDMTRAHDVADPATRTFAVVHAALERCGYNPPPLEQFIDELDDFEPLDPPEVEQDPTTPAAPDTAPSP